MHRLPPIDSQDVWAAGVTYERSRAAWQEEAQDGGDVYARVIYTAKRPDIFLKHKGPGPSAPTMQSASAVTRPGTCPNRNWLWS